MNLRKLIKDRLVKALSGSSMVPGGLVELEKYFRLYGPITFKNHPEGGMVVAVSTDFKYGSIVAYGRNAKELDRNIRDAILTSFEVPSAYQKEANLVKVGERKDAYATA